LVTNSFGIGGILETGDGKLLLCRRRGNLGVASASGTFGYSIGGNLEWNDSLRRNIDEMPAHAALASQGIVPETTEELGVAARFKRPDEMLGAALGRLALNELGLRADECSATPVSICRDGLHMGMPQSTYFLRTGLPAEEVVRRMTTSPDGKKEYDLVLAVDKKAGSYNEILSNALVGSGININAETRSSFASMLSQEGGRSLLS
jgi:hypothetical protein